MATQYILQPNGNWCVFSTITDCIIMYDMTDAELIDEAALQAKARAIEETSTALRKIREGHKNQFSLTLDAAIKSTIEHCDDSEWLEQIKNIGKE